MANIKRTLYLHLGAHKTGTTATQSFLRRNQKRLAAKAIQVIADRQDILDGHQNAFLSEQRATAHLRALFKRALSAPSCRTVIYSFEGNLGVPYPEGVGGTYPGARAGLKVLSDAVADCFDEIAVYYSIRSHDELIESYYIQTVKEGRAITFPRFMTRFQATPPGWLPVIDEITDAFGQSSLRLSDYSSSPTMIDFGLQDRISGLTPAPKAANPSYGDKAVEVALSILPMLETPHQKQHLRQFLTKAFAGEPSAKFLAPEERKELRDRYAKDLAALRERLGPDFATGASERRALT